ncbi:MAG: C39 family peptidase [Candidatus Kerfeldbacteria bacterium]|nr:C39 family peptidase [Candidatus Kerfeldbacteria bacterium]
MQVPFYTQHWNLDDWLNLGFSSRADAEYWERSSCGVLCLRMVIEFMTGRVIPTKELVDEGLKIGAYGDEVGWKHDGLIALAKLHELGGRRYMLKLDDLVSALDHGQAPIISIAWAFKPQPTLKQQLKFWKKYGGHLAVVVGYKRENGKLTGFFVHHTSKLKEENWVSCFIPRSVFHKRYTGRGMVVKRFEA